MRKISFLTLTALLCLQTLFAFDSFTGKITGNHVRLRLQPSTDSAVVDELDKEDLIVVVDEVEDFYAIQPPKYVKAYVFRTYIVDDVVEGNHVNVRLDPHLDAPIIAQLNEGEKIDGTLSPLNNKWYEIEMPACVNFYISKHFIDKVGGPELASAICKRKDEVAHLLTMSKETGTAELERPFDQIQLDGTYALLNKVIQDYKDFPEQVQKAKILLGEFQDSYLQKKIAYLESRPQTDSTALKEKNSELTSRVNQQNEKLKELEGKLNAKDRRQQANHEARSSGISPRMSQWVPVEEKYFSIWAEENPGESFDDFLADQNKESVTLRGVIEAYDRPVRNKPGDYLLINKFNNTPIAYLYSTDVDLQQLHGKEVTLKAALRPNNHFAYPAYFVLQVE